MIESILLVVHMVFTIKLALSCEQRRGNFDERLGALIPFFKEATVILCAFLLHNAPSQFSNIYYPAVAFALAHYVFCHLDDIYNFHVKKMIQGVSMFSLAINFILSLIYLTNIDRVSIIMVGSISYVILSAWLVSLREFDNFKIV